MLVHSKPSQCDRRLNIDMARLLSLVLFAGCTALAQSSFTACEADPATAAALDQAVATASDATLGLDARMAGFRALLGRFPADPFVNRLYLARFSGYNTLPLYDRLLPRYASLYREEPKDPSRRYLYALSRAKRDPQGSAAMLEALTTETSPAPWAHLTLAYIYGHIKPVDEAKAGSHLNRFGELCPQTLDAEALGRIASDGGEALKRQTIERLRRQLPRSAERLAMEAWPVLWQLEFQVTPASLHGELRNRIAEDLRKLRVLKSAAEYRRLDAVFQGYTLLNDPEGRRWAQAELIRVAPHTAAAADATIALWEEQNLRPDRSAPFAEQVAFRYKYWEAGKPWAQRWPNYGPAWLPLYSAFFTEGLAPEQAGPLGRQLAQFLARNPDYTFGFTDLPTLEIAERMTVMGVDLDAVPAVLDNALAYARERQQSDLASTVRPFGEAEIARQFQIRSFLAGRTHAILMVRTGKPESARAELDKLLREAGTAPADPIQFWRCIVALSDAAVLAGQNRVARDAIARMGSALVPESATATPAQKRERAMHEADYWESRAKLARAEGRGLDAMAYYVRATNATPRDFNPYGRSRLSALAQGAWIAQGGTEDGWQAYNPDVTGAAPLPQWQSVDRKMPAFALEDAAAIPCASRSSPARRCSSTSGPRGAALARESCRGCSGSTIPSRTAATWWCSPSTSMKTRASSRNICASTASAFRWCWRTTTSIPR